jgi:type VI secretion system secreted protein Hcp
MTNQTIIIGLLGIVFLTGLSVNDAYAAGYIKFDGIDGEATADDHINWINLESWSFGATKAGAGAGGGGGAGKVIMQDFHFDKTVDKSSPKLFESLTTGKHIKDATLEICRESSGHGHFQECYLMIKFTDVVISGYQLGGSGDSVPTDQISLNFAKIELEYKPLNREGSLDPPVKASYDVKKNVK